MLLANLLKNTPPPSPPARLNPDAFQALIKTATEAAKARGSFSFGSRVLAPRDSERTTTQDDPCPATELLLFGNRKDGKPVVSNSVFLPEGDVYSEREILHAYSSGSVDCSTNFERPKEGALYVEAAFSYAKIQMELGGIRRVLDDPKTHFMQFLHSVINGPSTKEELKTKCLEVSASFDNALIEGKDFQPMVSSCIVDFLHGNMPILYEKISKRLKEKPERFANDPVHGVLMDLEASSKVDIQGLDAHQALEAYAASRAPILAIFDRIHPELGKIVAQHTLYHFYGEEWEKSGVNSARALFVGIVRFWLLCGNPALAPLFFALHAFGQGSEFSDKDNTWAQQLKPPGDMGPLCPLLPNAPSTEEDYPETIAELILCDMKLLASANGVAVALFKAYTGRERIKPILQGSLMSAHQRLSNYNCHILTCGDRVYNFFDIPPLPEDVATCIHHMDYKDAEEFIRGVHAGLPAV